MIFIFSFGLQIYKFLCSKLLPLFYFFFPERREVREKERERNIDRPEKHRSVASCMPPTRDLTCNPGMCPNWKLNQGPFALWEEAQSTELHWSELFFLNYYLFFFKILFIVRERGGEREIEWEKHHVWLPLTRPLLGTWPTTQTCALTGNQTSNPLLHRPALNPLSHTSQG